MKVSVILGTRPEAIKLAPIILAMKANCEYTCDVCVTAQHRQMLDQVLEVFGITPDADLDLMTDGQTLSGLTARAMTALDGYLARERPDIVLVQGDTTTVFTAALAAFYHGIPVGHVEAGLRTWNLRSPWPEEANRVLTSRLAKLHFAPTESARQNLLREGVPDNDIFVTGNTVIDALYLAVDRVRSSFPQVPGLSSELISRETPLVLITGHRRESFGEKLEAICAAILELAEAFPEVQFVYPVHLNPQVRDTVMRMLSGSSSGNIHLIAPLSYLPFVALMERATLLITDSGGVQEEAPALGKPVLVTRDTTERPEALTGGTVKLVGADRQAIVREASRLLSDAAYCHAMSRICLPYGDGKATQRILDAIAARFDVAPVQQEELLPVAVGQ
ncbi:non-hydrolyzing UDP-N-acetylglucosamine 2-epimerase [Pseudacidobacterium ailaaui]|uniref:non-hydrolyzing UDP-N-acetylglucosamine 2-epimerase n=1 Tax=Pseudacidobacterium ailaaui TaxID=1382359 RepID=UPI0005D25D21|nr:UDP-N-acetylglucosamine 2-epimerase (non-hydrolyzing) [Pseudacidobacterium ailaaui]